MSPWIEYRLIRGWLTEKRLKREARNARRRDAYAAKNAVAPAKRPSGNETEDHMENAAIKLGTIPAGSVVTPELVHSVMVERIRKLEAENAHLRAEVQRLAHAK